MPGVSVQFSWPHQSWSIQMQRGLSRPELVPEVTTGNENPWNIRFLCRGRQEVRWDGLPYLASMSTVLVPRCGEEQSFTVLLLDYDACLVRKLLVLVSCGSSKMTAIESMEIHALAKDLGVPPPSGCRCSIASTRSSRTRWPSAP